MDNDVKKSLPAWLFLLYLFMIGFTFIVTPESGYSFILARVIQVMELLFFIALFMQRFNRVIILTRYNSVVNLWWLVYTIIAYLSTSSEMGLTPFFRWMNIIIFLLLGSSYWRYNMQDNLKFITIVFALLIYVNAILLIMYPDGLWIDPDWEGRGNPARYLFGNYNQIGFVCLLGSTAHALYTFATNKGRYSLLILLIVSIASVTFVGSMTSAIGLLLFFAYILFHKIIIRPKFFFGIFIIIYSLFFIFIIWHGQSIDEISLASQFIEEVLSKDTTFSNRTDIWYNTVELIKEQPWIGYGLQSVEWNDTHIGGSGTHNLLLMLLLQGGVILCASFLGIVVYVVKHALKTPSKITTLSIVALCVLLIMSLFETYYIAQTFLVLQFIYYSPLLVEKKEEEQQLINS